jgi:hypothetical protein
MPDLSAALPTTELEEAFLAVVDVEGKLVAALEGLGPMAGHDVILLDAGRGYLERRLTECGARVTAVTLADRRDPDRSIAELALLPAGAADAVVVPWSELATPDSAFVAAAERLLRPGGRLMLVHDYGRDDVWSLWPERRDRLVSWSQRRGPFLGAGFRVRVIHCWWTFESVDQARDLLIAGFGDAGAVVATAMKRPRLEYQVAIYHRAAGEGVAEAEAPDEAAALEEVAATTA